ncbi:MAG: hypothetical protein WAO15_11690 [Mycobacterium sp.]
MAALLAPLARHGTNQYDPTTGRNLITSIERQRGDSREYVIVRLERDDPDLATQVKRGEITATAASRAKGWKKPQITLSNPAAIARALRRHLATGSAVVAQTATTGRTHEGPARAPRGQRTSGAGCRRVVPW